MPRKKRITAKHFQGDRFVQDDMDIPPDPTTSENSGISGVPEILPPPMLSGPSNSEMADHGSQALHIAKELKKRTVSREKGPIRGLTDSDLQARELGLGLTMFGLAEVYGDRLQHMAGVVRALEQRVFSEEMLKSLPPPALIELYKLAVQHSEQAAKFIRSSLTTLNLDALRARLTDLKLIDMTDGEAGTLETITGVTPEPTDPGMEEGAANTPLLHSLHLDNADEDVADLE